MTPSLSQSTRIILALFLIIALYLSAATAEITQNEAFSSGRGMRADYDFGIEFVDDSAEFRVNERNNLDVRIENKGTKSDTYIVEIWQVSRNWNVTFYNLESTIEVDLQPGSPEVIVIIVEAPSEEGSGTIDVKAVSKSTRENHTAYMTVTAVKPPITMELDKKEQKVLPANPAVFYMNLTNIKDTGKNVTVSLGPDIIPSEEPQIDTWTYKLNRSRHIVIPANRSIWIKIEVFGPTEIIANLVGVFTVTAKPDDELSTEDTITVTIEELDLIEGTPTPSKQTGKPGDTVSFSVELFNNGTGDLEEVALFKGEVPAGFDYIYDPLLKYNIKRFESKNVPFQVSISENAKVGDYKLNMGIQSKFKGLVGNFSIIVEVLQNYGLELDYTGRVSDPASDEQKYFVELLKDSDIQIILKNTGNGLDTFKLNLSNVPEHWNVYFKSIEPVSGNGLNNVTADFSQTLDLTSISDERKKLMAESDSKINRITVELDSQQEVKITLGVNTSYNGKILYNFTVNAYSSNTDTMSSIPIEIILVRSELAISDVQVTKPVPQIEDTVYITVTIKNVFHIPAKNISVIFKVSDLKIDEKQISELDVDDTTTVDFEWTPKLEGLYILQFEISGAEIVPGTEPYLNRNITVEDKIAKTDEKEDNLTPILIIIVVIIVFTMLAVVLIYYQRERIRKLSDKKNEERKKKISENDTESPQKPVPPHDKKPKTGTKRPSTGKKK